MTAQERVTRAVQRGLLYPKRIAEDTGMTLRAVQQTLTKLHGAGVVRREGFGYVLTDDAEALIG